MASDHEKLTAAVVKLSSRPEIHESLRTVCIFSVLVAVWCGLRLYAMRVRGSPMKVEDSLFYISVVGFPIITFSSNFIVFDCLQEIVGVLLWHGRVILST